MDPQLLIFGGAGIALLIGCLVLRESTEVRLARMRTALMSLRNQERGLEQQIENLQKTKSQINEAMWRAQEGSPRSDTCWNRSTEISRNCTSICAARGSLDHLVWKMMMRRMTMNEDTAT